MTEKPSTFRTIMEYVVTFVVVLLVMGLIQLFIGRLYVIPSGSMEPTLHGCTGCTNDRIVAEKVSLYFSEPEQGDVVVFAGTDSWNQGFESPRSDNPLVAGIQNVTGFMGLSAPNENILVKRVIATGGQTVSCQAGDPSVMVDGVATDQSMVLDPPQYPIDPATGSEACGGEYFGPVTVPENHHFMMGDNRTNSLDSRYHLDDGLNGSIPEENLRGEALAIVFPFSRIGGV